MTLADERLKGYEEYLFLEIYFRRKNETTGRIEKVKKKIPVWQFIERFLWIKT